MRRRRAGKPARYAARWIPHLARVACNTRKPMSAAVPRCHRHRPILFNSPIPTRWYPVITIRQRVRQPPARTAPLHRAPAHLRHLQLRCRQALIRLRRRRTAAISKPIPMRVWMAPAHPTAASIRQTRIVRLKLQLVKIRCQAERVPSISKRIAA